jgi:hypothetical protein
MPLFRRHHSDPDRRTRLPILGLAFALCCAGGRLQAQELDVLYGAMRTEGPARSSYSYQVDYRQDFYRNFAASVGYTNEGHVPGHYRDGTSLEAWARLPWAQNRLALSLGAGAYYFYDTEQAPGGGSADVHGTAPIVSLAATGYLSDRWFCRAMVNRIMPSNDTKVTTAAVGVGFWFGRDGKPTPGALGDAPDERHFVSGDEVTVFGGQSVVNTFFNPKGRAYALEYRRGVLAHVDWTASLIYEGNPEIIRRSGVATQAWAVNTFFDDRVAVGIGLGPYFYIDRKHPAADGSNATTAVAPLGSLSLSSQLSAHWSVRLMADRVTSNDNRDADIFLAGLGYRWAR